MIALLSLLLALAGPPHASVSTSAGAVPLAVSSWCWANRCGAPIAASAKPAVARRGTTVRVELAFVPSTARVAVAGVPVKVQESGRGLSFVAGRAGGLTISVTAARGWIAYVGRLVVR